MSKMISELGNTYTYLTVIDGPIRKGNRIKWKCKCKCGNEHELSFDVIKNFSFVFFWDDFFQ